jgi:hypothetical protein
VFPTHRRPPHENCFIRHLDLINQSPRYAILSYVWGSVTSLRLLKENYEDLISIGSLKRRRAEIPETILNAIELVQSANLQYLWVDALCLVQDDESDDKKVNIPRMYTIYGGATLAIIAAAGPHSRVGLPGIGVTPRPCAQIREEIRPGVTMAVVNDVKVFLDESHYAKRG